MKRGAIDRVVLADVDVARISANGKVGAVGDVGEVPVLRAGDDLWVSEDLGLSICLARPTARNDVVRLLVDSKVHENSREEQRVSTLQEEHPIAVRDAHELSEVRLGRIDDLLEGRGAVAHLVHGHARPPIVEHLGRRLAQHVLGKHRRPSREVIDTCH